MHSSIRTVLYSTLHTATVPPIDPLEITWMCHSPYAHPVAHCKAQTGHLERWHEERREHIIPVLTSLHCLYPIGQQHFKVILLILKALNEMAPSQIAEYLSYYTLVLTDKHIYTAIVI